LTERVLSRFLAVGLIEPDAQAGTFRLTALGEKLLAGR
jgi:hypothetical protein